MDFYHQPNSIYTNDNTKEKVDSFGTDFYTLIGEEEFLADDYPRRYNPDLKVYAKKSQKRDGSFKFMIRTNNNGKLFDPTSVYGKEKYSTFLDRVCKSNDKFRTVNEKAFNWYIKFLRTKNTAWLYNAEREID